MIHASLKLLIPCLVKKITIFLNYCINTIFPNEIHLTENKRLNTKEDKHKLKQLKLDIFNKSIPIKNTIKKYFKFVDDITTEYNIAFKNETCSSVSKTVRISQKIELMIMMLGKL